MFLATGLRQGPTAREASEHGMVCRAMPLAEVEAMVRDGTLQDASPGSPRPAAHRGML